MKKIFIAIAILGLAFSSCAPDSSNGYGYNQTVKSTTRVVQPGRYEVPQAKRIGYNHDYGCFIYLLEAEGHKFVIYREDIEIIE